MSDHSHCIHNIHQHGLRHSLNDGISRTTNVSIVAKLMSVPEYGKNCAFALSGSGARLLVTFLVTGFPLFCHQRRRPR